MLLRWRGNLHFPDARLENTISARMTLAVKIRELRPRVVILPYWQARHPDHYRCGRNGLRSLLSRRTEETRRVHRAAPPAEDDLLVSLYADVTPSFIVDISAQFERRMAALLSYRSQYGAMDRRQRRCSRASRRSATGLARWRDFTAT